MGRGGVPTLQKSPHPPYSYCPALSITDMLSLKVIQDTFFKVSTASSSSLSDSQKVLVRAGTTLAVNQYEFTTGHLKVELATPISPLGTSGYIYEKHIQLSKDNQILRFDIADLPAPPPGFAQLWIAKTTKIKTSPEDSSNLAPHQQAELLLGETYLVLGYACVDDHFRVTLSQPIPGFGSIGYVWRLHGQIKKDGKIIPYDANALNIIIVKNTTFKKRPIDAGGLTATQKTNIPAGRIYGLIGYTMESGHVKVSLTENLPQFGNTGYLYPYHVRLLRAGKEIDVSGGLTYTGPKEVVVNQPITLSGAFDRQKMAVVGLLAEDKYSIPVQLNRTTGIWQASLAKGFSVAGARWLRLRGTDTSGQLLGSQVINIAVTNAQQGVGDALRLRIQSDTVFKVTPVDSDRLNSEQKVAVKAGQTFEVSSYGWLDGHLKVTLATSLPPVGNFGYFYSPHIQLTKGSQVLSPPVEQDPPEIQAPAVMVVKQNTFIKIQAADAGALSANQKAELKAGQKLGISGYASISGHFRVTLTQSISGFGNVGYVYWRHVQIERNGEVVPFNPDALTATMRQSTLLKRRPVDGASLSNSDKVTLPQGRVYGLSSYGIEDFHIKAALTEELPNFGNTGFIYPGHVLMRRGGQTFDPIPQQVELSVPYFSQRDNPRFYWSTCNVTSIAMVFYYYGERSKWGGQLEDELLEWCLSRYGEGSQTDHSVLTQLIRAYGYKHSFSTTRRWSEVQMELINRRPVVIAGDFTATGHITTIIGYNRQGYIVNDPWGDALTGYSYTEGPRLLYPYGYMDSVCGPDGNVWAHFISK